jgi:DNA-binding response OmpR family regulator
MPNVKQILVADRDPRTLNQVSQALRSAGYGTCEAESGRQALRSVQLERPDLALVSLALPDISGRDLARILEANGEKEPIRTIVVAGPGTAAEDLVDTSQQQERTIERWSHVDDVVTLVNGLFDVSEGRDTECLTSPISTCGVVIDPTDMTVEVDGVPVELTQKEFRFLQVLVFNEQRTCTREELKRLVWGHGANVIGRTVDVLVSRLRSKLEATTGRDLVATIRGIGYRFTG